MDKKELESFVYNIETNVKAAAKVVLNSEQEVNISHAIELTKNVYTKTASVPELKFAEDLLEILCRAETPIREGSFSEEELDEFIKEYPDFLEGYEYSLEMFINPDDLFFGGKIRPDIVFRKGRNNFIVFEVDSFMYHSNQEQLMKDKIRERKIQSLGYPVFRFAAKEILEPGGSWACAVEAVKILEKNGFVEFKKTDNG